MIGKLTFYFLLTSGYVVMKYHMVNVECYFVKINGITYVY
jgi:hypothetical protein